MTEVARLEAVLALVGLDGVTRGLRSVGAEADKTQRKMRDMGARMQDVGGTLTRRLTLPLVGVGVAAGKVGMDFDAQMSKVAAKAGATGADLEKLRDQAIDLGAKTSFSARTAAQGMEILAAAGLKPREIMDAMPGLLDAAAASGEDLASTADVVANSLAQFNLDASDSTRIADVLAKASNETQGSIASMGEALKYAGTGASQLGFDVEQTTALISKMVKAGIDGSQAGTSLRMGLQRLATVPPMRSLDKVADISPKIAEIWKSAQPVPAKLRAMSVEFQKLNGTSRVAAASLVFGTEASTGMLQAMKGGPASIDAWTESMRDAGGEAKRMGDAMRDNLRGDLEELGGAVESSFIGVFDQANGPLRSLAQSLTEMVQGFAELSPAVQQTALAVGVFAAAAGPALFLLGGMASGASVAAAGVTAIGAAIGTMAMAIGTAVPALASMSLVIAANPLLTGAVAIGAIIAAGVAIAGLAGRTDEFSVSAKDAAARARDLEDAINDLEDATIGEREAGLGVRRAIDDVSTARQAARDAVREFGRDSEQARDALLGEEQAMIALDRAMLTNRTARERTRDSVRELESSFRDNMRTMQEGDRIAADAFRTLGRGFSGRGGQDLARLKDRMNDASEASDRSRQALQNMLPALDRLAAGAGPAAARARELAAAIRAIPSEKDIVVRTRIQSVGSLQNFSPINVLRPQRNAQGGIIHGPGTGTSDSILSWVSNGEAVIPASSTQANRGVVEWMIDNPGKRLGLPAYRNGRRPGVSTRTQAENQLRSIEALTNLRIAAADRRVAQAESTPQIGDDLARLRELGGAYMRQELALSRFARSRAYRLLSVSDRTMVLSGIASARRSRTSAMERRAQLRRDAAGGAGGADENLAAQLEQQRQRAEAAEANLVLSQQQFAAFGSAGDLGFGGGRNAVGSARGMAPTIIVNSLTGYDPKIQQAVSQATSSGFGQGRSADVLYSGRIA